MPRFSLLKSGINQKLTDFFICTYIIGAGNDKKSNQLRNTGWDRLIVRSWRKVRRPFGKAKTKLVTPPPLCAVCSLTQDNDTDLYNCYAFPLIQEGLVGSNSFLNNSNILWLRHRKIQHFILPSLIMHYTVYIYVHHEPSDKIPQLESATRLLT